MKKSMLAIVLSLTLLLGLMLGTPAVSAEETVTPAVHEDHCVCNGSTQHDCQTAQWEPWTGEWVSGGYYYLTDDVELGYTSISADSTLTICLNGYDITGKASGRIFDIYGNLNICDHKENGVYGGTITGTQSGASLATVFYVRSSGIFNLYGGNITTQNPATQATIGDVVGTMNMYDGKIYGGTATGEGTGVGGGNIGVFNGTLNMYGGEISGGKALSGMGGNVFVNSSSGILNVFGGNITGGEASQGNDIYAKANITVNSNACIGEMEFSSGKTVSYIHDQHCFCNGLTDHACQEITWQPWTGTWEDGGYYYLTNDVELGYTSIPANSNLTICLSGHNITGKTSGRIFDIYGNLNICDHKENGVYGGTITGTQSGASLATVFYLRNTGSFNLFGGNITTRNSATQAAIGVVAGTMNLYDGKIYGGTATGVGGGNIGVFEGRLNMYGGEISGGKAENGTGGNVFINSAGGELYVYAGTITGGQAAEGKDVYSKADITVGAVANIGDLVLASGKTVTYLHDDTHCVCAGNGIGLNGHNCTKAQWEPWTGAWVSGGYYYLTDDVELGYTSIPAGSNLTICLNGYQITGKASGRIFDIYGTLNICDHEVDGVYAGHVVGTQSGASLATVFYLRSGGTFNMYGGNITTQNSATQAAIGVVAGTMNLYDGKIYGGEATANGTSQGGGNIGVFNGTLNMFGGEISGGKALSGMGGNVFVNSASGQLNISGGKIADGEAVNGGNIYTVKATISNAEITNGIASGNGGNLCISGTATVSDSTLIGGNANRGGSVYISGNCQIIDSTVETGTGSTGRVAYVAADAQLTLDGATFNDTSAAGTCIWNVGTLVLKDNVTINKDSADALDIMLDCRNASGAYIDVSGLTGQDAAFSIRRWENGNTETLGLLATGAESNDLYTVFRASIGDCAIAYADGCLYLAENAVVSRDANSELLAKYANIADALNDTVTQNIAYYAAKMNLNGGLIDREILFDLAGFDWTDVAIAEGVEVMFTDSATDDFDCSDGYGTVTLAENNQGVVVAMPTTQGIMQKVKNYVTIPADGSYSFHRYYASVTKISLQPTNDALGYKAEFYGDAEVQKVITGYGFKLWVEDGPAKLYGNDGFANGTLTLRLKNILAANGGTMNIHAQAYVNFCVGDEESVVTSTTQTTTMKDTLTAVNAEWESYTDDQRDAVKALCNRFAVTAEWGLDKIFPAPSEEV